MIVRLSQALANGIALAYRVEMQAAQIRELRAVLESFAHGARLSDENVRVWQRHIAGQFEQ